MSTPNFHVVNCDYVYAIDDVEDVIEWKWKAEAIREDLSCVIKEKGISVDESDEKSYKELNCHPTYVIGEINGIEKYYGKDLCIEMKFVLISRAGYYRGASLDYEIRYYVCGYEYDDMNEVLEEIENYPEDYGFSEKYAKRVVKWAENWMDKMIAKYKAKIESVYKEHSLPLTCKGVFSNGEAVYEEVNF